MSALKGQFDQHLHTGTGMDGRKLKYSNLAGIPLAPVPNTVASTGSSGTITLNMASGNVQNFTFSGSSASDSITLALTSVTANQIFLVSVTQNSGGSGTVTWFSTIRWAGGSPPTLTTTGGQRDTFGFIATSTNTFDGFVVGLNI